MGWDTHTLFNMKLVIDIGNTRIKAALFEAEEIVENFIFHSTEEFIAAEIFENAGMKAEALEVIDILNKFATNLKEKKK